MRRNTARVRLAGAALGAMLLCGCAGEGPSALPAEVDLSRITEVRLKDAVLEAQARVEARPDSAATVAQLGAIYLIHDWYEEAAMCYRRASELDPEEMAWPYLLGRCLMKDDAVAAEATFRRACELDGSYTAARFYRARVLVELGRTAEAEEELRRVRDLDPRHPFATLRLGELAAAAGRSEAARELIGRALALNPGQSEAHAAMAPVLMALGEPETARKHSEKATRKSVHAVMNDSWWGRVQLAGVTRRWIALRGQTYLDLGQYQKAVDELSLIQEGNEDPSYWMSYGAALLVIHRPAEALPALEKALAHSTEKTAGIADPVKIHINLGLAAMQLDRPVAAEEWLQKALELAPSSADVLDRLSMLYYQQGRPEDAIAALERARIHEPNPRSLRILAGLLREGGREAEAARVEAEMKALEATREE